MKFNDKMTITEKKISVKELVEGFEDNGEGGVKGFAGKLDIRPPYQREFVYNEEQQQKVIETVMKGFPLNVMYWVQRDDGNFEVLDGQQRTMSICSFATNRLTFDMRYFSNLTKEEQEQFLNYKLFVYVCRGDDSEKLKWFQTINIAGVQLKNQEILNAIYAGSFVSNAKTYFSKRNAAAHNIGHEYLVGECNRQDYLETAIKWICNAQTQDDIALYMAEHQHDKDATPLWEHFRCVINWVKDTFPTYRQLMKGLDWGTLYKENKDRTDLQADQLEKEISSLLQDEDVTNKKGVYLYVLDKDERHLSIRAFLQRDKVAAFEKQAGKCAICGKTFKIEDMQADHKIAWSKGGKTTADNCQLLCAKCNLKKSNM